MQRKDPLILLLREVTLAAGMIGILVLGLYAHTGSMPPLVVVESSSMIHEENGEVGSIDAGDLVLVHDQSMDTVTTFAEASNPAHPRYGYEQHGMPGDVIIYDKNGDGGTPIIHRAILEVVAHLTQTPDRTAPRDAPSNTHCPEGGSYDDALLDTDGALGTCVLTWNVPGTAVVNASTITIAFDGVDAGHYDCKRMAHANVEPYLVVWNWTPSQAGMLTLGDNNHCSVDQGSSAVNGSVGVHSESGVVRPVRDSWLIGVAGGELPWLGTVKLALNVDSASPGTIYVPNSSYLALFIIVAGVLLAPMALQPVLERIIKASPELKLAQDELAGDEEE
ncbi:S26 family signal peptidase [Candidatus Poseidoniaceae archaeon]|nr:S26 family signal peptidase [Candidatus Poseidoniaceae archaeon]